MAESDWRQAEGILFEESQKVIREFAQKHPDTLLSLFAYTVDAEYSGVGINFDTPANSLRKAKVHQRHEIETRNRLFAPDNAWKSAHYYAAGAHGEIDDFNRRGPWQYEVVSFVPLAAWEQAWEEFCSNPPSDEDDEAGAKLEGRIIVSLWRVVDRLVRSDVFDVLKRATPFRIGYAFHDAKLVVLGILNWPELASE
jgi:hypothetical protein